MSNSGAGAPVPRAAATQRGFGEPVVPTSAVLPEHRSAYPVPRPTVRVTTAAQAAECDAAAIAAGTPGFTLMLHAGTVAAAELVRSAPDALARGVCVLVGSGNNGGDGYVVAAQLARLGVSVQVLVAAPPRTPDAQRAEQLARHRLADDAFRAIDAGTDTFTCGVVVDALLGTGARGAMRGAVATGAAFCRHAFAAGVSVFALDVPSGVDATTGETSAESVRAHCTITFGTCKSGLLAARGHAGRIVVADIGLGAHVDRADGVGSLADASSLRAIVPAIPWDAHKGTRGRVLVVGGDVGMSGAAQFACRGALLSGSGLVRAVVHTDSVRALQAQAPAVVCVPMGELSETVRNWAHAVVVGPGLGRDAAAATRVREVLMGGARMLVLDADALVLLASDEGIEMLREATRTTTLVLTPHAGEFARLAEACGTSAAPQERDPALRADAARAVAARTGATVLLKGAPTICAAPDGTTWFVPRGTPVLATGGTGDMLAGVLAAVLAAACAAARRKERAGEDSFLPSAAEGARLAALAAWVHGVAGELAQRGGPVRGTTVDDVVHALRAAWHRLKSPDRLLPGILAELPDLCP